ncbi:MAG: Ni/Fe-hydrogenase, b-type cytochrome subunit [Selenomonadaceae bacterium]|nr:Ni/Fe-hydrogenase, b-type cytochrome subunit [Selenomonadaceae bacterium]
MANKSVKEVNRKEYYIFSPFLRIFHWIMASQIVILFATGLLITKPMNVAITEPVFSITSMDLVRDIHFTSAFILCASLILRIYGFIVNKGDRLFPRVWEGHFYEETVDVALHYMLIRPHHASFLRNPLARGSYAALYVMLLIEILTGFAMYFMTSPYTAGGILFGWVNTLAGSEMMVHYIHHYVAWFIILFAIGHMYMVIRAEFMEGESEISSMFSGKKILAHTPKDANELD